MASEKHITVWQDLDSGSDAAWIVSEESGDTSKTIKSFDFGRHDDESSDAAEKQARAFAAQHAEKTGLELR